MDYVSREAIVGPQARVEGGASVGPYVRVVDHARVGGNAVVVGRVTVSERGIVSDYARVEGLAHVCGFGLVTGNARVGGNAQIRGEVDGLAVVEGDATVLGYVKSDAHVYGNAVIPREATVSYYADVFEPGHVIVFPWDEHDFVSDVTVYRTATGHQVQAGCQNFTLDDDLEALADEHNWPLPEDWHDLVERARSVIATWH